MAGEALGIVRPRVEIVRPRYLPIAEAKEVAMTCELCGKVAFGPRSQMHAAMEEHKRIGCTGGEANERRVYRLNYRW